MPIHLLNTQILGLPILLQLILMGDQYRCSGIGLDNKTVFLRQFQYLQPVAVRLFAVFLQHIKRPLTSQ